MKTTWMWQAILAAVLLVDARTQAVAGQVPSSGGPGQPAFADSVAPSRRVGFEESDWSGPRLGFMFAPGDAAISHRLKDNGLGGIVSQFGWHFEKRVVPFAGGPTLVTEAIPLFGGVEYGKFVPSLTTILGLRTRSGIEFGMGPSLTLQSAYSANLGLVIAAGRSIDYGDMSIPLNLAVSTNPKGTMISLVAGYSMHQMTR
jgi:hypothetical protein